MKPGWLTTIQDTGRPGFRQTGVTEGGAADKLALRLSNLLVGNPENTAALEITLIGPEICLEQDLLLALTGADLAAHLNGEPLRLWRPVWAKAGSRLGFGRPVNGCRAYLAVAGGFTVSAVMGSYATYLTAGFGGWHGRALLAGDVIPVGEAPPLTAPLRQHLQQKAGSRNFAEADWRLHDALYPRLRPHPTIYALKGPEYAWFTAEAQAFWWEAAFQVSPQANRMGLPLTGPLLAVSKAQELLSTAVTYGTVQVTAQGNPIVLLADHQTTGGYPRLAQVITTDFTRLAQVKPGETLTFKEISLPAAQQLYLVERKKLESLKSMLRLKFKTGK